MNGKGKNVMCTHKERERERKDYYSVIKQETLPFATKWMDLDRFMLSEIRQRQILYVLTDMWMASKKILNTDTENRLVVVRVERAGKMREGGQRYKRSYKISQSWGCNVQHGDHSQDCIVYVKVSKRVTLKSAHHRKAFCNMYGHRY